MAKIDKKENAESAGHPPLTKIRLESLDETIEKIVYFTRNCRMNIPIIRKRYNTIPSVTEKHNYNYGCEPTEKNIASILKIQNGE